MIDLKFLPMVTNYKQFIGWIIADAPQLTLCTFRLLFIAGSAPPHMVILEPMNHALCCY